jgi:hypothetical protein
MSSSGAQCAKQGLWLGLLELTLCVLLKAPSTEVIMTRITNNTHEIFHWIWGMGWTTIIISGGGLSLEFSKA